MTIVFPTYCLSNNFNFLNSFGGKLNNLLYLLDSVLGRVHNGCQSRKVFKKNSMQTFR